MIHTAETFDVLTATGVPDRTVFHAHGRPGRGRRCLDLGGYLSFSGIVTFKTADDRRGRGWRRVTAC